MTTDTIDKELHQVIQQSTISIDKIWPMLAEELTRHPAVALNVMLTFNARFLNGVKNSYPEDVKIAVKEEYLSLIKEKLGD